MPTVTPHIIVRDASTAANWCEHALGARLGDRIQVPDGRHMKIEVIFGDSSVMIADEFPELGANSPLTVGGTYGALTISVTDADASWKRALDAGAVEVHPMQDAFWGERHGQLIDPFGHRWGIAQTIEEVSADEVQRRALAVFGGPAA